VENAGEVKVPVETSQERPQRKFFGLSQNVFVFGFVSMLTDFSSEVTVKTLPLFLANALGVQPAIIGFIEGFAETTATILKWVFGWLSDRLKKRKWLAFTGYAISNITKPFLYFVNSWPHRPRMLCWLTPPRRRSWDVRSDTAIRWIPLAPCLACWRRQA
jgi:nitrate/nitrite transporter NarK